METVNARIVDVAIEIEDHGLLTMMVTVDYGGSRQGFGGFAHHSEHYSGIGVKSLEIFIWNLLDVTGTSKLSNVVGKSVRVKKNHGLIKGIGHFLEDKWFYPSDTFQELQDTFENMTEGS
jgi:hypothetical protein